MNFVRFPEKGYCMRGDLCQWDHGSDPVVLEDASAALSSVLALPPPSVPGAYCISIIIIINTIIRVLVHGASSLRMLRHLRGLYAS